MRIIKTTADPLVEITEISGTIRVISLVLLYSFTVLRVAAYIAKNICRS